MAVMQDISHGVVQMLVAYEIGPAAFYWTRVIKYKY